MCLKMALESIDVRNRADFTRQSIPQFWRGYLKWPIAQGGSSWKEDGSSRRPLEDDLNLYAPGNLTEISSCKLTGDFPWMVLNVKSKIL